MVDVLEINAGKQMQTFERRNHDDDGEITKKEEEAQRWFLDEGEEDMRVVGVGCFCNLRGSQSYRSRFIVLFFLTWTTFTQINSL